MKLLKPLFTVFFLCYNNTNACTCLEPSFIEHSYNSAEVAINARIISSKELNDTSINEKGTIIEFKEVSYSVVILHQYKGKKMRESAEIITGAHSCGDSFAEGETYLIFAKMITDSQLGTGACFGNRPVNKKDHKRLLKLQRKNRK